MLTQSTVSVNNKHGIFRGQSCFVKVLRQQKGYGANSPDLEPGRLPDLGEDAGACVSQPES